MRSQSIYVIVSAAISALFCTLCRLQARLRSHLGSRVANLASTTMATIDGYCYWCRRFYRSMVQLVDNLALCPNCINRDRYLKLAFSNRHGPEAITPEVRHLIASFLPPWSNALHEFLLQCHDGLAIWGHNERGYHPFHTLVESMRRASFPEFRVGLTTQAARTGFCWRLWQEVILVTWTMGLYTLGPRTLGPRPPNYTPLMMMACCLFPRVERIMYEQMITALLNACGGLHLVDNMQNNAVMMAARCGNHVFLEYFLSRAPFLARYHHEFNWNAENIDGWRCFDIALRTIGNHGRWPLSHLHILNRFRDVARQGYMNRTGILRNVSGGRRLRLSSRPADIITAWAWDAAGGAWYQCHIRPPQQIFHNLPDIPNKGAGKGWQPDRTDMSAGSSSQPIRSPYDWRNYVSIDTEDVLGNRVTAYLWRW